MRRSPRCAAHTASTPPTTTGSSGAGTARRGTSRKRPFRVLRGPEGGQHRAPLEAARSEEYAAARNTRFCFLKLADVDRPYIKTMLLEQSAGRFESSRIDQGISNAQRIRSIRLVRIDLDLVEVAEQIWIDVGRIEEHRIVRDFRYCRFQMKTSGDRNRTNSISQ